MEKDIMLHYIQLVEFLGLTIGPDYEIVLYDLRREDRSIIAISNGHVSGRTVGAPLTESALKSISHKEYIGLDNKINYTSVSHNNKLLRSSTLFIKDGRNELIGLLSINFDDTHYVDITEKIMSLCHPNELLQKSTFEKVESITSSEESDSIGTTMEEVAEHVLNKVLKNTSIPPNRLTKDERMDIVRTLDDKGVFMLKGSVPYVAKLLHSSEATIYRYLNDINSTK